MVVEKRRQGRDGGRTSEAPAALAKGALVSTAARTKRTKYGLLIESRSFKASCGWYSFFFGSWHTRASSVVVLSAR